MRNLKPAVVFTVAVLAFSIKAGQVAAQKHAVDSADKNDRSYTAVRPLSENPRRDRVSRPSYYVDCEGRTPRSARSPVLSSSMSHRAAYGESSARVSNSQCVNTSKLFVRNGGQGHFDMVYLQPPNDTHLANGIRPIDWSFDGTDLLFEVEQWQRGSDAPPVNDVIVYSAVRQTFKTVPLDELFSHAGEGCYATVEPLGFASDGSVALRLSSTQYPDEEGLAPARCKQQQQTWLFHPRTNRLSQTADQYTAYKWSKVISK